MSLSCGTGTAAVQSEGAACRLEAVFLCGLHTFVHLWALAHVEPFWSHPTHATKGYRQGCGCPQPLVPLVSPGGGLSPRCCATCASASGDFPPWQSRRTLTRLSTSLQNNTKEGPYQDRPLLYPFRHNPSLPGSCSSPGSALPQKIEKNSFTQTLAIPKHNPNPIHTAGFRSAHRLSHAGGHVQELHLRGSPEIGI